MRMQCHMTYPKRPEAYRHRTFIHKAACKYSALHARPKISLNVVLDYIPEVTLLHFRIGLYL